MQEKLGGTQNDAFYLFRQSRKQCWVATHLDNWGRGSSSPLNQEGIPRKLRISIGNSFIYALISHSETPSTEWPPTQLPCPDKPGLFSGPGAGGEPLKLSPKELRSGWHGSPNTSEGHGGSVLLSAFSLISLSIPGP